MSALWNYFQVLTENPKYCLCMVCGYKLSRGSAIAKNQTRTSLKKHLQAKHPDSWNEFCLSKTDQEIQRYQKNDKVCYHPVLFVCLNEILPRERKVGILLLRRLPCFQDWF